MSVTFGTFASGNCIKELHRGIWFSEAGLRKRSGGKPQVVHGVLFFEGVKQEGCVCYNKKWKEKEQHYAGI